MASTNIFTNDDVSIGWEIIGLQSVFEKSFYIGAGVSSSPASGSGQSNRPQYNYDHVPSFPDGTWGLNETDFEYVIDAFVPSKTYTIYGYAQAKNNLYYPAGSDTVTMSDYAFTLHKKTSNSITLGLLPVSQAEKFVLHWSDNLSNLRTPQGNKKDVSKFANFATMDNLSADTLYYYSFDIWTNEDFTGEVVEQNIYSTTTEQSVRPDNWIWTTDFTQGATIQSNEHKEFLILPATEWNNFTSRVNEFRNYLGLSPSFFSTVQPREKVHSLIMLEAVLSLEDMPTPISPPSSPSSGDTITALFFNRLRDSLNSIT